MKPTPVELAYDATGLVPEDLGHLQRLMGVWVMLADLSFSDLLLLVPVVPGFPEGALAEAAGRGSGTPIPGAELQPPAGPDPQPPGPQAGPPPGPRPLRAADEIALFVVLGQMRPTTSQTLYQQDLVGEVVDAADWSIALDAWKHLRIATGELYLPDGDEPVRVQCIPVCHGEEGHTLAVLVRVFRVVPGRRHGELEQVYLNLFDRLAQMIVHGDYPFTIDTSAEIAAEDSPRVGDGILVVNETGSILFCSPNAINALHRMGIYMNPVGKTLGDLGVEQTAVDRSLATGLPVIEEIERRPDVTVLLQCTPLTRRGVLDGLLAALRDITDLRHRDRLLLSKDVAIREVHHRVKNNLQTISALLRLQARRMDSTEATEALREAERRIRSIALVHEILSREPADQVPFAAIMDRLVLMAEESVISGRTVKITVEGDAGELPAETATPLAVALAELLQNAVEHAFGPPAEAGEPEGHVDVRLALSGGRLHVCVRDDGNGLPADFTVDTASTLGLSIVRDLVTSQLGGTIELRSDGGTAVDFEIPVAHGR